MTPEDLDAEDLAGQGIHTVIVATPDLQGRLVGRRLPVERFADAVDEGVEICMCVWAWDIDQSPRLIANDSLTVCGLHNGLPDATLVPDLGSLRRVAWLEGVALCFADPVIGSQREPLSISPRVILRKELERYASRGLHPNVGTELEFYLFLNDGRDLRDNGYRGLRPTTPVPSDFMIEPGNTYEAFFAKLRQDLRNSRVAVEAAQSEAGPGQWEMTFVYGDPLAMADQHALYKMAVREAAAAAGMSATFMARPLNDSPGSSCHIHLSIDDDEGDSIFWDVNAPNHMGAAMRHAIAGVLHHSVEVTAWYAPTVNAFRRINSADVAGTGRTWGFDNRTTTIRVLGRDPGRLRFEFRMPGADANPYLSVTAVLASARDGIDKAIEVPDPVHGNAYALARDEAMPRTLGEAASAFASSSLLPDILTRDDIEHFRVLYEHEWDEFLAKVSDWDHRRYFDRI